MAVHVNRHLADNQYIAAIGVVYNKTGHPFLLAETFNPTMLVDPKNQPPALLIALPKNLKQAYDVGLEVAKSERLEENVKRNARNKGVKKTDELARYMGIDTETLSKKEIYGAQQVDMNKAVNRASFFEYKNKEFVAKVMNLGLNDDFPQTQWDALRHIEEFISSGRQGHFFKINGFVASSHDPESQNVFDGYPVDFPDPNDPSKTFSRQVVTGTALGLEPIFSPRSATYLMEKQLADREKAAALGFTFETENNYKITAAEKVVFATQRTLLEQTELMHTKDVHGANPNYETDHELAGQIPAKTTAFQRMAKDGFASIASKVSVKNEVPLALSHIAPVADPDEKIRAQAIVDFKNELGKAITEYHQMHSDKTHAKDLLGMNTGLVLDVWSKTPSDESQDGVKNGYKTRQGFGMYVDLQDKSKGERTADNRTQSIMDQLKDVIHLRDQATINYLGERTESKTGRPPKFNYKGSLHHNLTHHLNDLVKAETEALKHAIDNYLVGLSVNESNSPEIAELTNISDGLNNNEGKYGASIQLTKFVKDHPLTAEKVLSKANLAPATKYEIQRTTNAITDIEKKYAASTGLRSLLLADRETDTGPIVLNPNDAKFGQIETPEWFHRGDHGMSDSYYNNILLPTKQITTKFLDQESYLDSVTLLHLPKAGSVYGELMKDMASLRDGNLQTPELQKNRILTHPTFQVATVKRWASHDNDGFNKWYNSNERDEKLAGSVDRLKRYNDHLSQIQPASVGSGSIVKGKDTLDEHGFHGTAYIHANPVSLGTIATRHKKDIQQYEKEGKLKYSLDSNVMTREERSFASNFGKSYTTPIAAYKPHLITKDGQSMKPISPSVGSFQILEGTYPPALGKTIGMNFDPSSAGVIKGHDRTDYTSHPYAQALNPMNDLSEFNAQLERSSASFRKMVEMNSPGLQHLGELGLQAFAPIAHEGNIQFSFLQMQRDKNNVDNTVARERDYDRSPGYNNRNSGIQVETSQYERDAIADSVAPTDDQRRIAEQMSSVTLEFSMPTLDIDSDLSPPAETTKPQPKTPSVDNDDMGPSL